MNTEHGMIIYMKKFYLLLLVLTFSFSGCEKDDICDANTVTTPRLLISFFDYNNPLVPKNVSNLKIIAEGMTDGIVYNNSQTINGSQVAIPLKTDDDTTTFHFFLNSNNPDIVNEDIIQFNYTTRNIYVSRACGYKINFNLSDGSGDNPEPFIHTDAVVPDLKWMEYIAVKNSIIENENETHLEVYF